MQRHNKDKSIFIHSCPLCDSPNQLIKKGCFEICGMCGWEDDPTMQENPDDDDVHAIFLNKDDEHAVNFNQARRMWRNGETLYEGWPNPKASK